MNPLLLALAMASVTPVFEDLSDVSFSAEMVNDPKPARQREAVVGLMETVLVDLPYRWDTEFTSATAMSRAMGHGKATCIKALDICTFDRYYRWAPTGLMRESVVFDTRVDDFKVSLEMDLGEPTFEIHNKVVTAKAYCSFTNIGTRTGCALVQFQGLIPVAVGYGSFEKQMLRAGVKPE